MRAHKNLAVAAIVLVVAVAVFVAVLPPQPEAQAMQLQPLGDTVITKIYEGGNSSATRPQEAVVLAVGPGKFSEYTGERIPMDVSVGDHVLMVPSEAIEIDYQGDTYFLVDQDGVLAVVR